MSSKGLGFPDTTIFNALTQAGVSNRYFYTDLPLSALWGAAGLGRSSQVQEYYERAAAGTLPALSFVDPAFQGESQGTSGDEHPLADIRVGQAFVADVVHAFMSSPQFKRGALFMIYDEWGGFFDHVVPPRVPDLRQSRDLAKDFGQMGFRIPAVVVSPYARRGHVDHSIYGFESIIKMIRYRYGLPPLTPRDLYANNIAAAFDFVSKPDYAIPDLPHAAGGDRQRLRRHLAGRLGRRRHRRRPARRAARHRPLAPGARAHARGDAEQRLPRAPGLPLQAGHPGHHVPPPVQARDARVTRRRAGLATRWRALGALLAVTGLAGHRGQLHPGAAGHRRRAGGPPALAAGDHRRHQPPTPACSTAARGRCGWRSSSRPSAAARSRPRREQRCVNAALAPQPATGKSYSGTVKGSGRPSAYGAQTVCAFLEDTDIGRVYANDESTQVTVSKPCTTAAGAYDKARAALARAQKQLRHSTRADVRRRLTRTISARKRTVSRDKRRATTACGRGVPL